MIPGKAGSSLRDQLPARDRFRSEGKEGKQPNLQKTDFRGANLQGAALWKANLQEAYLEQANLQGADLEQANLRGADLFGVHTAGFANGVHVYPRRSTPLA
ncbi:MAG: pentapeptide repeat-containing protein [Gammaproteobacteria bacterium]|nr:pentapeptide repeat-containing protein [Gammaproteobacteria bacterium]